MASNRTLLRATLPSCIALAMACLSWAAVAAPPGDAAAADRADAAQPATASSATQLPAVEVIAVTPSPGAQLPVDMLPYSVQGLDAGQLQRAQTLGMTDLLNRRLAGVTINEAQGNPLQPDLQFRGFTATPLLGGSEGMSVYVDGVRVNEVFGDTVNWDLIPQDGIGKMTLISGANPVFGLNTLGGVLDIASKNGFTDPGTQARFTTGSYGRNQTTFESGGNDGQWGYYLLADHFEEGGWRDASHSNAKNFMGTLSWRGQGASVDLHLSHADTDLTGNGTVPVQELALRRKSVFTAPDNTRNHLNGISAQGSFDLGADTVLTATLYGRHVDTRSYNGDDTDFDECDDNDDILCDDDGEPVIDQNGDTLPSTYNAINNIGQRRQRSVGGSVQLVFKQPLFGLDNQFAVGVDLDHGRLDYSSVLQAAVLLPGPYAPFSVSTSDDSGIYVPDAALQTHVTDVSRGIYFTDTLSLTDRLALTASGRYNHTRVTIDDVSGQHPDLDGRHGFQRFNPALGLTYRWSPALNFYAGYSESTRAPTPVELTCASPDAPCLLPNDFLSDPSLKQVVAKSWEAGLRGRIARQDDPDALRWEIGLFRTTNEHDILFQAVGGAQSNQGFYANVGETRRQGVQASLSGRSFGGRLDWYANYTWLDATFRTAFDESSANSPYADPNTGLIRVQRGDRLPNLPKEVFKLGADWSIVQGLSVGGDVLTNSGQYLRGDESNQVGKIGGFTVANLHASYRFDTHWRVFARVDNVFDRHYADFGMLGDATDLFPGFTDTRFVTPGARRGEWIGAEWTF